VNKKIDFQKIAIAMKTMAPTNTAFKTMSSPTSMSPKGSRLTSSFGVKSSSGNVTSSTSKVKTSPSVGPDVRGLATKMAGFIDEMEKQALVGKALSTTARGVAKAGKILAMPVTKPKTLGGKATGAFALLGGAEILRRGYQTLTKDQKITDRKTMRKVKNSRAVLES